MSINETNEKLININNLKNSCLNIKLEKQELFIKIKGLNNEKNLIYSVWDNKKKKYDDEVDNDDNMYNKVFSQDKTKDNVTILDECEEGEINCNESENNIIKCRLSDKLMKNLQNKSFKKILLTSYSKPNSKYFDHKEGKVIWGICKSGYGAWYIDNRTKIYEGLWSDDGDFLNGRIYEFIKDKLSSIHEGKFVLNEDQNDFVLESNNITLSNNNLEININPLNNEKPFSYKHKDIFLNEDSFLSRKMKSFCEKTDVEMQKIIFSQLNMQNIKNYEDYFNFRKNYGILPTINNADLKADDPLVLAEKLKNRNVFSNDYLGTIQDIEIEKIGQGGFGGVYNIKTLNDKEKKDLEKKVIKIMLRGDNSDELKYRLGEFAVAKMIMDNFLTTEYLPEIYEYGNFGENCQEKNLEYVNEDNTRCSEDVGECGFYVVMEKGSITLEGIINKLKSNENKERDKFNIIDAIQKLVLALNYLHENFIFHNDIKPDNIMCFGKLADGLPNISSKYKFIDFGISDIYNNDNLNPGINDLYYKCSTYIEDDKKKLSGSYILKYAPVEYINPKLVSGNCSDDKICSGKERDYYSFGLTLLELVFSYLGINEIYISHSFINQRLINNTNSGETFENKFNFFKQKLKTEINKKNKDGTKKINEKILDNIYLLVDPVREKRLKGFKGLLKIFGIKNKNNIGGGFNLIKDIEATYKKN